MNEVPHFKSESSPVPVEMYGLLWENASKEYLPW